MSEKKSRIEGRLNSDKTGVELKIFHDNEIAESIPLSEEGLTTVISQLGALREQLVSGKEPPSLQGIQINAVIDTKWYCEMGSVPGLPATLLSFQHPAFGPVGFLIPIAQITQLIGIMTQHVLLSALNASTHSGDKE